MIFPASPASPADAAARSPQGDDLFRRAFDHVPVGMALLSIEGRLLRVNRALCETLGYGGTDLHEIDAWSIVHPDDYADGVTRRRRLLAGECDAYECEVRCLHARGHAVSVACSVVLLPGEGGDPPRLLVQVSEMPERQRAEAALRASEERFRGLVDAAHEGIWALDQVGRTTYVNPRLAELLGHAPDAMLGRQIFEYMDPATAFQARTLFARWQRGIAESHEVPLRRADGGEIWAVMSASPLRDSAGTFAGALALVTDITERRRAEAALRESEARFRRIADAAPVFMWTVDVGGACTFVNRAWLDFTGRALEDELGDGWMDGIHPIERTRLGEVFEQGVASQRQHRFEVRFRRQDGEYRWILSTQCPWYGPRGEFLGLIGTGVDITERRRVEEARQQLAEELERRIVERTTELAATNRRLEEATRHKSDFLAAMSHEFRTPLNAIIGFAELIRDGRVGPVSADQGEYLDDVLSSANHLLQLVSEILDIASTEAGRLRLAPERVDVAVVVAAVRDALRPLAERQGVAVRAQTDPSLSPVTTDPKRLRQVLFNFLSNALKYTPAGGRIEIRSSAEGEDRFRIEVEDTGIGIAAADLPRLFNDFERVRMAGAPDAAGTGLGLAVSRRIVEAQGGAVGVRSVVGLGSVFHAVLPRAGRARPAAEREPVELEAAEG